MHQLSIITICYNDREGLERTLSSLRKQTTQAFDHIIVDGGSTDGSVELVRGSEQFITKWVSEADKGIYDAQNKGWRMAGTPFVQFLNAGDELASENVLARIIPVLTSDFDIVFGDSGLADQRGLHGRKQHPARITSPWLMKEVVSHSAQFIRKELLEHFHGYNTRYMIAADYAFFAQAFWNGQLRLRKLDILVSVFDTRGISSSPLQKEKVSEERKEIQRRYAPRFWYMIYQGYATFNRMIGR